MLLNHCDYYRIVLFALAAPLLVGVLGRLSLFSYTTAPLERSERRLPYECGFIPFESARIGFKVQFYLVGLLFLIFDLELLYLFPGVVEAAALPVAALYNPFLAFFLLLVVGFVFE
jgi:NADH:ubiquinone oxidoreductase subunit 3 (subunit A)